MIIKKNINYWAELFMVSKELEMIIKFLRKNQILGVDIPVEQARQFLNKLTSMTKPHKDINIEAFNIKSISAEWISAPDAQSDKIILYLHGGGYVTGSIDTHRAFISSLSQKIKCHCLSIDYRLAPENPFPAALDDAITAYRWLIEEKMIHPSNLIIAGESAGGGLTLSTIMKIKKIGLALPSACMVFSPWADLLNTGATLKTKKEEDPFLSPEVLFKFSKMYYANDDPKNPLISPLYGDFKDFPPLLIQVGTSEILLSDSTRVAERAKEAGVDVTIEQYNQMIHAFQLFESFVPEGKEAMNKINNFVQKIFFE
ncbi:MAG: alpha/beta hydrolase [Candidatus Lokiarchaeota archaeon]|nr:alpha/beta hydrolase [Candidatus Lokiarchaeota archaeon]